MELEKAVRIVLRADSKEVEKIRNDRVRKQVKKVRDME
jgi:hypothetical protein